MKTAITLTIVVLVVVAWMTFGSREVQHSGFSFGYRNGDCAVWYSRKGRQVFDVLVVPRTRLQQVFDAGSSVVTTTEGQFPFGTSGRAYVLDGDHWVTVSIEPLNEGDIPHMDDLAGCSNITQIAERVIGRKISQ